MTPASPPVVRPGMLWLGAALAVPAALGMGATWAASTGAVFITLGLLGVFGAVWAAARGMAAVSTQLLVSLVGLTVLVTGVLASGVTGSLLPATGGAAVGVLSGWLLRRRMGDATEPAAR